MLVSVLGEDLELQICDREHDFCSLSGAIIPAGWPQVFIKNDGDTPPISTLSLGSYLRLLKLKFLHLLPPDLKGRILQAPAAIYGAFWSGVDDGRIAVARVNPLL